MYIRSTIDTERLTGLALMNVHFNDTEEIIHLPRRIK